VVLVHSSGCAGPDPPAPGPPPTAAGPPTGAALGPQYVGAIAARWAPLLPDDPQERNRLLSRRMKAIAYPGDWGA